MTPTAVLVQWCSLTAVAALLGAVVLDVAVLPQAVPEVIAARQRLDRWIIVCALIVLLASSASLIVRATTMAGGRLGLAIAVLPRILTQTHFGPIWIARVVAVVAFLFVWPLRFRMARLIGLALTLGVALTTSLTGHAADWGAITVRVFADWVHVVSSAIWVGGLFGLAAIVLRAARAWPGQITGQVAARFSSVAGACLVIVVVAGAYNSWIQIPFVSVLWTTTYGRVLVGKIIIVAIVVAFGAFNRFTVVPALAGRRGTDPGYRIFRFARYVAGRHGRSPAGTLPRLFSVYVSREAILGVAVFACSAVLTESTPPRHEAHLRHTTTDREPYRLSMEELHKQGGIPTGWTFRPAEGDPDRGRDVFVKLACFSCHAVTGESFPQPSRPGPDLSEMGRHHPAGYLAESVMNPNAVIVEGPGYTGSDGLSIMPDYRDHLTVAELDDLVAYLKSLE